MRSHKPLIRAHEKGSTARLMKTIFVLVLTIAAFSIPIIWAIFFTLPSITPFLFEVIPSFWVFFRQSFTPRNLFILLNLIILTIFAIGHFGAQFHAHSNSSTAHLQSQVASSSNSLQRPSIHSHTRKAVDFSISEGMVKVLKTEAMYSSQQYGSAELEDHDDRNMELTDYSSYGEDADADDDDDELLAPSTLISTVIQEVKEDQTMQKGDDKQAMVAEASNSSVIPSQQDTGDHDRDWSRPLSSERFTHRKLTKLTNTVRDRSLSPSRISRPIGKTRAGETLDATWKAICESKRHSSPLGMTRAQHINIRKKSSGTRDMKALPHDVIAPKFSPTIHSPSLLSPLRQRPKLREPSIPQEELNAKVEAFISSFFERNRIQRERSMLDYVEMVSRGAR